ncbi:hypothetical protein [Mycobacterium sp. CnD-18-1]|uniref:hypothetical protein n=1 Tax=Mycobacterium sp. CnD-18-1 TaxID=2917744 RepID=UPI001EF1B2F4|nr:hypothetical protein [Mycobacterium sp. CnD-18-1]MCG7607059.1 hypothetical protein [Mycobacterium sp. CnD-18-1]
MRSRAKMCSPELTKGMCCICFGTLTPDNTLYDDLNEGRGGVHRGVCAILAGIYPDDQARETAERMIAEIHAQPPGDNEVMRRYYRWVHEVAEADFYDNKGPE